MPLEDAYAEYQQSQVLTADPLELVRLLYRGALDAVRSARVHLAAGRIADRCRQISKAHAIVTQLSVSLDHTRGETLSHSLAELYDYMQRRLIEANARQKAEPLLEVENLLATMLEGWEGLRGREEATAPRDVQVAGGEAHAYGGYPAAAFTPAAEYISQSWSF